MNIQNNDCRIKPATEPTEDDLILLAVASLWPLSGRIVTHPRYKSYRGFQRLAQSGKGFLELNRMELNQEVKRRRLEMTRQFGAYTVTLPLDFDGQITKRPPKGCEYCGSAVIGIRCDSCGAPKRP